MKNGLDVSVYESGEREQGKARSRHSRGGRSIWTTTTITPYSPTTLIPYPLGSSCVFIFHPKCVAHRDPNLRQVLMRERERGGGHKDEETDRLNGKEKEGQRNCLAFARLFQQAVTAEMQPPPFFFSLSLVFDVRSKAAVTPHHHHHHSPSPPPLCQEGRSAGRQSVMLLFWDESAVWCGGIFEGRPKGKSAYHKCKSQCPFGALKCNVEVEHLLYSI